MLPPRRQAEIAAAVKAQTAPRKPQAGAPREDVEAAAARAQLRAFLTDASFAKGAALLRRLCSGELEDGTLAPAAGTTTEHALMLLGMQSVWRNVREHALYEEPAPRPEGDEA